MTTMPPMHYSRFLPSALNRRLVKFEKFGWNLHPAVATASAARTHPVTASPARTRARLLEVA